LFRGFSVISAFEVHRFFGRWLSAYLDNDYIDSRGYLFLNTPNLKQEWSYNMLILDFDGVLINSLDEVVVTAYNATTAKLVTSPADLPTALVGLFQRNRFHVQSIGDGVLLMNWCLNNYRNKSEKILNPHEYEAVISGAAVSLTDRTLKIYETRGQFIAKDPKCWLALHQPYQPLWDHLIQRQKYAFVLLTNKNRDATLRLCRHFGIGIQAVDIYSGDRGTSKAENMRQIQKRFGDELSGFIDDSVKNLRELQNSLNLGNKTIPLLLASWGYTGPRDEKIAQEYGYPVLNQKDLISLLDKDALKQKNVEQ
jgi:phosphoglycolate phosphatase-like HAD superfamily hydrolase